MLIKCPDCNHTVSNRTSACLVCGCPFKWPRKMQVISKTSKELKGALLKWIGLFLLSLAVVFVAVSMESIVLALISIPMFLVGIAGMAVVKCQIGWEHE